jgi:hypothetical protein
MTLSPDELNQLGLDPSDKTRQAVVTLNGRTMSGEPPLINYMDDFCPFLYSIDVLK